MVCFNTGSLSMKLLSRIGEKMERPLINMLNLSKISQIIDSLCLLAGSALTLPFPTHS